jgi:hypothetical protein
MIPKSTCWEAVEAFSAGQRAVSCKALPVSSMLLRLERMWGQPLDTAAINFDEHAT